MKTYHDRELATLAYYGTGGRCAQYYLPESVSELAELVGRLNAGGVPWVVLGGGSNTVIGDGVWPGAVIGFQGLTTFKRLETGRLLIGAGYLSSKLAEDALALKLGGASWIYRLPGQFGGAVRMNARCYGGEISQIVRRITAVDRNTGQVLDYTDPKQVFRGYKDTLFMDRGDLICEVEVELRPDADTAQLAAEMQEVDADRRAKGHFDFPSCGCVFKNDHALGVSSGLLLDHAGAKGRRVGGAVVSSKHANFIYNKGAKADDIIELSLVMREMVYQRFGVWMSYEMEVLGRIAKDLLSRMAEQRPKAWRDQELAPLRELMRGRRN